MVYGIKVNKPVEIRPNSKGKLTLPGVGLDKDGKPNVIKTSVKEISSVSYWLELLGVNAEDDERMFACIKATMARFPHSVHVLHVNSSDVKELAKRVDVISEMPVVLHFGIEEQMLGADGGEVTSMFSSCCSRLGETLAYVDRIMLDDKTSSMFTTDANRLRELAAKTFGFKVSDIGICGSPLSTGDVCCLSAQRSREWAAKYVKDPYVVLVSANHQNSEGCGCLREAPVNSDRLEPEAGQKSAGKSKPKTTGAVKIKKAAGPKRSPKAVRHP